MRVVGIKKMSMRKIPRRVKYPNMTVMLPTNSKTMAPNRKKEVFGMPNLAMYWAVPSKFPIFPIPELRKIKTSRILPIKLPKAFNHSIFLLPVLKCPKIGLQCPWVFGPLHQNSIFHTISPSPRLPIIFTDLISGLYISSHAQPVHHR
jgi:hypothetical protein